MGSARRFEGANIPWTAFAIWERCSQKPDGKSLGAVWEQNP
jgi:hypothetical protein